MKGLVKAFAASAAVTGVALVAVTLAPVSADSPGQIDSGTGVYVVKNLTQNGSYSGSTTATCGDELEFSIRLHNSGYGTLNNINVATTLPANGGTSNMTATYTGGVVNSAHSSVAIGLGSNQTLSYENGTTKLYDGNDNLVSTLGDTITGQGVNVGSLYGSTVEFVNYKAKVSCPTPPPAPVYTCDELDLTANESDRSVKLTVFNTTAKNGATFKNAVISWGDNSANLTTNNVVGQTHQYAADGTYTIAATAHFTVNGQDVTAGGASCEKQVTFKTNTPPTVTPPTTPPATPPATLVNTGAGNVAGIFAAATVAGIAAYRFVISRRLSRQ